jgi:cob(I)alamin adenosyltransferase
VSEGEQAASSREHKARMEAVQEAHDRAARGKRIKRGVIVVNTGDGKGKSTAAFGMAIRAAGHGQRVAVVQFIKGTWKTGEQVAIKRFPEITHVVAGDGFTWVTQDREKDIASTRAGWQRALEMIEASREDEPAFELIVLDELNVAIDCGYLPVDEVVTALSGKPAALSIVVTGHRARPELIAIADTVTEMSTVKHAFQAGIKARRGIEY